MSDFMSQVGQGLIGGFMGLGMNALSRQQDWKYYKRTAALNDKYFTKQNKFLHGLQLDMWNQTNAKAQMDHLIKAGLNPGLMYGGSGAGGTTNTPTGGGAPGQNPNASLMGIGLDMMRQKAEIDNIKANTDKTKEETENVSKDTEKKGWEIVNLGQDVRNKKAQERLTSVQADYQELVNEINTATKDDQIEQIGRDVERTIQETIMIGIQNSVDSQTINEKVDMIKANTAGAWIENALKRSQTDLNAEQIKAVAQSVSQKWNEVSQGWAQLNYKAQEVAISKFSAEISAEYPGVGQMLGKALNDVYDAVGEMPMMMPGGYMTYPGRPANSRRRKVGN